LNGKAIGPLADDDVDTPVTGDRGHDDGQPAGPGDPRDVVLEFGTGHFLGLIVGRAQADEGAAQEMRCRRENGWGEGPNHQALDSARAQHIGTGA